MKCSQCGQDVAEGMSFCPSCGGRAIQSIPQVQLGKCPACGADIPSDHKFCAKCGTPATTQDLKCRRCGADVPEGTKFCPNCGTSTIHTSTPSTHTSTASSNMSGGNDIMGVSPDQATFQWFPYCITKKYCDFNGRARRREFWFYALFSCIVGIATGWIPLIGLIVALGLLMPALGVHVRRLHDIGKSGWFLLIGLIPIAGIIILLVMEAQEGNRGPNQYGADPKMML